MSFSLIFLEFIIFEKYTVSADPYMLWQYEHKISSSTHRYSQMYTRQLLIVYYFSTFCHRIKIVSFVTFYLIMHFSLLLVTLFFIFLSFPTLNDPRFYLTFLITLNFYLSYTIVLFSISHHHFTFQTFTSSFCIHFISVSLYHLL